MRVLALIALLGAARASPKHFVAVLVDDMGVGYPSWLHGNPLHLVHPEWDALKEEGLILNRAYTYRFCSPSRASILTGRAGFRHVASEANLIPWSRPDCVDREYDMWPKLLGQAGYHTVHVGKWHQGMYDTNCLPLARGFDEAYGFISGGEDHFTQKCFSAGTGCSCRDLWNETHPSEEPEGEFNTVRFTKFATDAIKRHAAERGADEPLAMYFALHVTHAPCEAPNETVALYNFSQPLQNEFHAMVTEASKATGAVVDALKEAGMWEDTLFWFAGDNGSPTQVAGSNAHLKGGKGTSWDGGYAVPSMVSGGVIPQSQRGKRTDGLFHFSDIFATVTSMAGIDPSKTPGPAPMDGYDQLPFWTGQAKTSPRQDIVHDHWLASQKTNNPFNETAAAIARTIDGTLYKFLSIDSPEASHYGWWSPNATCDTKEGKRACFNMTSGCTPTTPCLYDLDADPGEFHNIAADKPQVLEEMKAVVKQLESSYHPPPPSPEDNAAYCAAIKANDGFMAPWVHS